MVVVTESARYVSPATDSGQRAAFGKGAGRSDSNRRPPRCCRGALPLCYDPALLVIIVPTRGNGQGITQLPRPPSALCLSSSGSSSVPARQRRSTPPRMYAACAVYWLSSPITLSHEAAGVWGTGTAAAETHRGDPAGFSTAARGR